LGWCDRPLYNINADTLSSTFLECLEGPALSELFQAVREDETTKQLEEWRHGMPPLALIGDYMARLGQTLRDYVTRHQGGSCRLNTLLHSVHLKTDGTIEARLVEMNGGEESIRAETLILALGGYQDFGQTCLLELYPGVSLRSIDPAKIMLSDHLLRGDGVRGALKVLRSHPGCRVVILGGSHSAFSAAWVLINLLPPETFSAASIRLRHRDRMRVFYPTAAEAHLDGYIDFTAEDICPATRRVFRLGGLRGDGRQLWRCLSGPPGTEPEPRVVLQRMNTLPPSVLRAQLQEADLIICALGYRPHTVPVFNARGRRVRLMADQGPGGVDSGCRVRRADGRPLPNVFSLGLASGYVPTIRMGGEASFVGQQNSLWLYQNDVGQTVHQGVQDFLQEALMPSAFSRARSKSDPGRRSESAALSQLSRRSPSSDGH
jgi:hypothetical protein